MEGRQRLCEFRRILSSNPLGFFKPNPHSHISSHCKHVICISRHCVYCMRANGKQQVQESHRLLAACVRSQGNFVQLYIYIYIYIWPFSTRCRFSVLEGKCFKRLREGVNFQLVFRSEIIRGRRVPDSQGLQHSAERKPLSSFIACRNSQSATLQPGLIAILLTQ